jgi:hypothetical protein
LLPVIPHPPAFQPYFSAISLILVMPPGQSCSHALRRILSYCTRLTPFHGVRTHSGVVYTARHERLHSMVFARTPASFILHVIKDCILLTEQVCSLVTVPKRYDIHRASHTLNQTATLSGVVITVHSSVGRHMWDDQSRAFSSLQGL